MSLRRVVLIDDNELTLRGFAEVLSGCPEIELVAATEHTAVLVDPRSWSDVDVVVLDAADEDRCGDQFPGVQVVRHLRRQAGDRLTVVVITGHFFDDGLRHRMANAGADFFFLRSEVRSSAKLVDIVLHPESYRRGVPPVADPERLRLLGITPRSAVETMVGYVEEADLGAALSPGAPDVDVTARLSRRSVIRHRQAIGRAGKIQPMNATTGAPPNDESRRSPSLPQVSQLWRWAARVKYGRGLDSNRPPDDRM